MGANFRLGSRIRLPKSALLSVQQPKLAPVRVPVQISALGLATWSATQTALDSKEGKEALKDLFKGITDCKENRLWKITPTG